MKIDIAKPDIWWLMDMVEQYMRLALNAKTCVGAATEKPDVAIKTLRKLNRLHIQTYKYPKHGTFDLLREFEEYVEFCRTIEKRRINQERARNLKSLTKNRRQIKQEGYQE